MFVVRDVRRRTKPAQARSVATRLQNPKFLALADLPSSCEISGTRDVRPASARPENVLAVAGEKRCLDTTRKLLQFGLQRGSPNEEVTIFRRPRNRSSTFA